MLVVEDLLRRVDADGCGKLGRPAVVVFSEDRDDSAVGKLGVEHFSQQAGVIAYRKGNLDAETVKRMRDALLAYSETPEGKQHLAFWKMTAFEDEMRRLY